MYLTSYMHNEYTCQLITTILTQYPYIAKWVNNALIDAPSPNTCDEHPNAQMVQSTQTFKLCYDQYMVEVKKTYNLAINSPLPLYNLCPL